jgi:subtilase family serine protease
VLQGQHPLANLPPTTILPLTIGLHIPNKARLQALIQAQSDIHSPLFHRYLTPAQFTNAYSPSLGQVNAVTQYLRSSGLTVSSISASRLLIKATGTVTTIERAFQVNLAYFTLAGRKVFAPTNEPSVPAALAQTILNIGGLNDVAQAHPLLSNGHTIQEKRATASGGRHKEPHDPQPCTGLTFNGYIPTQLEQAYDISPLTSNGYTGSGQRIALFELSGFSPSDISAFQTCLGPTGNSFNNYSIYSVDGKQNTTDANTDEVELDMDVVQGIAPYAQEMIYEGSNYDDTLNAIVNSNPLPQITSISWGNCEAQLGGSELLNRDNIFAQGAAEGIAFFAASGDDGGYGCGYPTVAVNSPADDPAVIGVGGTNLFVNGDGSYNYEEGWSMSGGGISGIRGTDNTIDCSNFYFTQPWYQTGNGVSGAGSSLNLCGARQVPDVSAEAGSGGNPPSGYEIFCTVPDPPHNYCLQTGWTIESGTSAAAPLWAAIAADVNQYLINAGKQSLGWPNALFYQMFRSSQPYSAYHDITIGDNSVYASESGYDMVTGIGSPDAWNLALDVTTNRIESDVFWGAKNNSTSTEMLNASFQFTGLTQQYTLTDASALLRAEGDTVPSLVTDKGKPGVISYISVDGHPIASAFAYLTNGDIGEFTHDLATNAWSFVSIGTAYGQTVYNPSTISEISGSNVFIGLFGITSSGKLIEYYHSGAPSNPWSQSNLSDATGVTCDAHISPSALMYPGGITEIFADCGNRLTQFFYSNSQWNYNQAFNGANPLNIPNASEAFPGQSISTTVVATTTRAMEVYIASDRNGVNALSEALYSSASGWSTFNLPNSSYIADQVSANMLQLSASTSMSEVFVTSPSTSSCTSTTVQYVYQPANPSWHTTTLALGEVTDTQTTLLPGGMAYSQADSGDYTGTISHGAAGGGACTSDTSISVGYSYLGAGNGQGWYWPTIVNNVGYPGDNAGVDPAGVIFTY